MKYVYNKKPLRSLRHCESKKPQSFALSLGGIGLPQLVRFIYSIESSDKVFFVVNLNIRPRYLSPELLDVSLRLATPTAQ